jgi:FPC/CPF motif-containing protein YcgG
VTAPTNPFATPEGVRSSNYCLSQDQRLVHPEGSVPAVASPLTEFVHASVLAHMLNPRFTCLGAKSAVRQRSYRFGLYPALGADASTAGLAHDLFMFVQEAPHIEGRFITYIASFEGPPNASEADFESLLWRTLQALHDSDAPHHAWDPTVSDDVTDARFSFSFAGTAFFVVGLHAASSRATRRLAWPTLIFNPHRQFETLKADSRYARFRDQIRTAETALQGAVNPMLTDFGERSEAAQYSGRAVEHDWRCPFATRHQTGSPEEP